MKGKTVLGFLGFLLTWLLILSGGIETVWGLCQVYGYTASNHSLCPDGVLLQSRPLFGIFGDVLSRLPA